jgi:hypothetical protein
MPSKQVIIRMPESLHTALKERATAEGISFSRLINQVSKQHLLDLEIETSKYKANEKLDKHNLSSSTYRFLADTSELQVEDHELNATSLRDIAIVERLNFLEHQILLLKNQVLNLTSALEISSALSETRVANYQSAQAFSQPEVPNDIPSLLSPVMYSTLKETSMQWLCVDEAYIIAQQQGYSHSLFAFKVLATCLKNPGLEYKQYQLGIDLLRYTSRGNQSACFYRLSATGC